MFKSIKFAAIALLLCAGFTACDDNDDPQPTPPTDWQENVSGAYIINQGNQYGGVDGSLTALDVTNWGTTENAFKTANGGMSLGDSPQAAVHYGSKIYLPVFGSNKLWVLNAKTLKIEKDITVSSPEAVYGAKGYVFVASNDGNLTRLDTLNYTAKTIAVGPNPASIAYSEANGGEIFVSISDGYNYQNGYANGKKVAVVQPENFTVVRNIAVGTNPGQLVSDKEGNIYVVARGDYATEMPHIQRISTSGEVTELCGGQLLASSGSKIYVVDFTANYKDNTCTVTSAAYTSGNNTLLTDWHLASNTLPAMPQAININPTNGDLYISSDDGPNGYARPGFVYIYNANGQFKQRISTGIHPFGVVFK